MTRINVVPVGELCDQHLLAEHRELTRIPNMILSGKLKDHYDDRPLQYTLGKGHVKFFTNKVGWLFIRYIQLHKEAIKRGFDVVFKFPDINQFTGENYIIDAKRIETPDAMRINRARILENWPKEARYYGKPYY